MAQFFRGDYGSALGRVDTRPIVEAGRAQGQMFANLGGQIGNMIQQYGLNKQKRAKLTGEIEAYYQQNPEALSRIGMSGDEVQDKKDLAEREKFVKGDMNMAQLEGYAGKLARGEVLRSKKLQDESRMIANQTGRFALELQEELRDSRVAQEKLTTELRQLMLDENKAVSPAKIKDILDKYNADAATRPFETDAKIAQAEDIIRRGRVGAEKQDLLGGPTGVAAQELTKEGLEIEQIGANIDRTRGLTDLTKAQLSLLNRPIDPSIPGNSDNSKILKDLRSDISALRTQKSFTKNDEGEFVSLEDLIEFDVNTGKATISENASKRDEVALRELVELVESEYATSMNQIITHTFKNGQTVTAPMGDVMRLIKEEKDKELADKMLEDDKLRNLRSTQGLMRMDYNYTNLDPAIAEIMAGPR